jgi:hypothetical protein
MMSTAKPKVLVCVLTGLERTNWINPELSMMLFRMGRDPRFDVEVAHVKDARPVEVARNHTIKAARDHNFDWLVSVDSDNFMPVGTPLDIIAAAGGRSVIGLRYGMRPMSSECLLFPPLQNTKSEGPFLETEAVGGGVLMVHRKVWEKIPTGPWFRWQHCDTETLDQSPDGCGEDIYFCRLVRSHGIGVFTHRDLLAGHYRTTDITGMVCELARSKHPTQP